MKKLNEREIALIIDSYLNGRRPSEIARTAKVAPSTVTRNLNKNGIENGYDTMKKAQQERRRKEREEIEAELRQEEEARQLRIQEETQNIFNSSQKKSRRVQLLVMPWIFREAKKIAFMKRMSFNAYIEELMRKDANQPSNVELIDRYNQYFGYDDSEDE